MSRSASSSQPAGSVTAILPFLTFSVGAKEFAVSALEVDQVLFPLPITRLPHSPEYVLGVIIHRGQVLPVVDMRRRLRLPPAEPTRETSMIALRTRGLVAALLVDRVTGFLKVAAHEISSDKVAGNDSFVTGIALPGGTPKIVLDLQRLIDPTGQTPSRSP